MLRFWSHIFLSLVRTGGTLDVSASLEEVVKKLDPSKQLDLDGVTRIRPDPASADLFQTMENECDAMGLDAAAASARRIRQAYRDGAKVSEMNALFAEFNGRVLDQLSSRQLWILEPGKAHFFAEPNLFGEAVAQRFPTAIVDIEEAGKCLALDRATACVFHLMRVLEVGLQAFGARVGLALANTKNWQTLLNDVQGTIRRLPQSTRDEKEYLGKCQATHAHLQAVKDAWRNDVMHPLASYTPEQALEIWNHSAALMRKLAEFV